LQATSANFGGLQITGTASIANLNISGATTPTNLTVTGDVAVQGTLTVYKLVVAQNVLVNGKIISRGGRRVLSTLRYLVSQQTVQA
jgi:cytoskeletal protein CcmA (bactofilin family)